MDPVSKFWSENLSAIALILAFFAFIHPWLIALWKRYFRNPQIEIYPLGSLEIGYSDYGPTIGIHGVILAIHDDVFIKTIRLKVRNAGTREEHDLSWLAFRSPAIVINPTEKPPMELPAGFIVNKTDPYRFYIEFYDSNLKKDLDKYLQPLKQTAIEIAHENQISLARGSANWIHVYNLVYDQYAGTVEYINALNQLNKSFYWKRGLYQLEIQVDTNKGNTEFIKMLTFQLTDEEESYLLKNCKTAGDNLFRIMAGEQALLFYFAYPEFKEIESNSRN